MSTRNTRSTRSPRKEEEDPQNLDIDDIQLDLEEEQELEKELKQEQQMENEKGKNKEKEKELEIEQKETEPEFFLFDESDIEDTFEFIDVIEEQLLNNEQLILNKDQINSQITTLLSHIYKSNELPKKVQLFMNLLDNDQQIVHQSVSIQKLLKILRDINVQFKPIISSYRYIIQHHDKDDVYLDIDEQYKIDNNIKSQDFEQYIDAIISAHSLEYTTSVNKLHLLCKPFSNQTSDKSKDYKIEFNTDSFQNEPFNNEIRLISSVQIDIGKKPEIEQDKPGCITGLTYTTDDNIRTLYEGDQVLLTGFFNQVSDTKHFEIFKISEYLEQLQNLQPGDEAKLFVNDQVIKVVIKKNKDNQLTYHISTDDSIEYMFNINDPQDFFLYSKNYDGFKYTHSHLKTTNLLFPVHSIQIPILLQFILPLSYKTLLQFQQDTITSHNDRILKIQQLLDSKTFHVNLKPVIHDLLKRDYTITETNDNKHYSKQKIHRETIHHPTDFIDKLTLIKKKLESLDINKKKLQEKHQKLNQELKQAISNMKNYHDMEKDTRNNILIAKEYKTIEDLEKDNNKTVYFDKDIESKLNYKTFITPEEIDNDISLRNKLETMVPFEDIDFIIESLHKGKRKVRNGDHCILVNENKSSILYKRTNVDNIDMWVKVKSSPFILCSDDVFFAKQLEDDTLKTLDPIKNKCTSFENSKQIHRLSKLQEEISSIEYVLDLYDNRQIYIDDINRLLKNEVFIRQIQEKQMYSTYTEKKFKDDVFENDRDADLIGEDYFDYDSINRVDFESQQNYLPVYNNKTFRSTNCDELNILLSSLDIDVPSDILKYIEHSVKSLYPISNLEEKIKSITDSKETNRNYIIKSLKKTNHMKAFEVLEQRHIKNITQAYHEYYGELIIYLCAILIIIIVSKYPSITIKNVIPKCISNFSYDIYLKQEDDDHSNTRNICKYFACLLSSLGTPNDNKFDQFHSLHQNEIFKKIHTQINDLLKKNKNLQLMMDARQKHRPQDLQDNDFSKYMVNEEFRPYINISTSSKLSTIRDILNSKVSFTQVYEFSKKTQTNKIHSKRKSELLFLVPDIKKQKKKTELFENTNIEIQNSVKIDINKDIENVEFIKSSNERLKRFLEDNKDFIGNTYIPELSSDESWDAMFAEVSAKFTNLEKTEKLERSENTENIRKYIVNMTVPDAELLKIKNAIRDFLMFKTYHIYKFVNLDLVMFDKQDIRKNICILFFMCLRLFERDMSLYTIFETQLKTNYFDVKSVDSKIEELREQKKQDMMSKYSSDEDIRKMQITLKNMGLDMMNDMILDIFEKSNKDDENDNITDYQGENPDDNETD